MGRESGHLVRLTMQPGMVTDDTDLGAGEMGTWKDGNLVRFKNGLPQTLGGWVQQVLTGETLLGVPRSNLDWVALDGTKYVAVGTEKRLYIIEEDLTATNITPIRDSGVAGLTDPFSTDTGGAYDPNVTGDASYFNVLHASHGVQVGDIVNFASFTSPVGGITVNGDFEVIAVTDTNNYVLQGATDATSTVTGGGTGDYIYEITVGSGSTGVASGWGTGPWGEEAWGTPRSGSTFVLELRTWSLDNWGEDLIASPRGGEIYQWDKSNGLGTRAQEIVEAPDTNLRVFVSPENRQLISLGAHNGTTQDPLFVAWTDNEDFTTWIPAPANTAGDKRLDQGSEIVTGLPTRVGIIVFTDKSVHAMQPTGGNEIYSFRQIGSGISIAGPAAVTDANGIVYFMGRTNFYVFDGVLRVLQCPVWTRIFDTQRATSLNQTQSFSTYCSHSKDFNEVWWFYPSVGESLNDLYVVYNYVENIWYFGEMDRASFHDFSPFFEKPFGFDSLGNLYTHEDGEDDNGVAMESFIESGDLTIADGDQLMHVSKLIPDFDRQVGDVTVTLKGRKYPQKAQFEKGPYTSTSMTDKLSVRIRARQIAIRVDQNVQGGSFRMGSWASRMRPDGER